MALYPFVDSPRFGFFKERDGQELLFTNGKTLYLIVLAFLINHDGDQDTEIVFQHKWLIDWRYRPHVHGTNSRDEPIVYQAEQEEAMEFINQLSSDGIANTEDISLIRITWV